MKKKAVKKKPVKKKIKKKASASLNPVVEKMNQEVLKKKQKFKVEEKVSSGKRKTTMSDLLVLWEEKLGNDNGLEGLISYLEDTIENLQGGIDFGDGELQESDEDEFFAFIDDSTSRSEVVIIQTINEMKKRPRKLQKILDDLEELLALDFILGIDDTGFREDIEFPTGEGNQF
tara:strand:+ start:568 stop:1089 length:522 start_codon:yes stop_codon:yes gene_type:complete